ncbi:hypothetical protein M6B38_244175 [Iris pallida]|uniref:Uncharacterized protein n=1 Tax=Iris pallida TaxID=29817 RepID=A0AAX6DHW0_IRIPA|nr:hypothetical protein M6B38_244175 [Iris pallida]
MTNHGGWTLISGGSKHSDDSTSPVATTVRTSSIRVFVSHGDGSNHEASTRLLGADLGRQSSPVWMARGD